MRSANFKEARDEEQIQTTITTCFNYIQIWTNPLLRWVTFRQKRTKQQRKNSLIFTKNK